MANYIVLEMDLNDKWWDKWFVVGGLSIDRSIMLHLYNYFSVTVLLNESKASLFFDTFIFLLSSTNCKLLTLRVM